jgi:Lrp/AsnC family transcriptional regulator for asnA, asnC and gidA
VKVRAGKIILDNIDYFLIEELQSDGRIVNVELAKKLGVGEATIRRRIRRLRDEEVIRIAAIPNLHKIGYGLKAIVMLKVQLSKLQELAGKLAPCPDIHYLAQCTGDFNLLFWLVCPTTHELAEFIKTHLAEKDNGIEESRIVTEVELIKRTHDLLPQSIALKLGKA